MPVLPAFRTGFTPFLQGLTVPGIAFRYVGCKVASDVMARRRQRSMLSTDEGFRDDRGLCS